MSEVIDQASTAQVTSAAGAPDRTKPPASQSSNSSNNALASLIFSLQELVSVFTGTMRVFQERFQQLSDNEADLSKQLKNKMSQAQIMKYKAQIQDVQNQQQLSSVSMQGASSNESTMLTMLGNVVKIFGNTLISVAQSISA